MLIVTKTGDIVNMDNVFCIETVDYEKDGFYVYARRGVDSTGFALGKYDSLSEVNNVRNKIIAAHQDGASVCRI